MLFERKVLNEIPINVWDDYDDHTGPDAGNVKPASDEEPDETYAYVESDEISELFCRRALQVLADFFQAHEVKAEVVKKSFNDSPDWRWELKLTGLTHEKREEVVSKAKGLKVDDVPLNVYSES